MAGRLSVGIETNCTAPMKLERMSMPMVEFMGVDSLFLPDHHPSFTPRSVWGLG